MAFKKDFNIFIGGVTGCFKGIKITENTVLKKNLQNIEFLNRDSEITAMTWGDTNESDIIIGTRKQQVRVYDSEFKAYGTSLDASHGTGPIVGLTRFNDAITTCSESGHVKVWKYKPIEQVELKTGNHVSKMQSSELNSGIIATGGKENALQLWSLEKKCNIFKAKYQKDFLELQKPVYISDIVFFPDSQYKVAVTNRHGQVWMYDTKAKRAPVIDFEMSSKRTPTTIALTCNEYQVLVGTGDGFLVSLDLRNKGKSLRSFKGAVGSIRQVVCHPTKPFAATVGLDSYLRIYDMNTAHPIHQEYLKVQLNTVLMRSNFGDVEEEPEEGKKVDEDKDSDIELVTLSDDEYEDMFDNMEKIVDDDEPSSKRKKKKKSDGLIKKINF